MEESSQQSELQELQCFTTNCRQWAEGGVESARALSNAGGRGHPSASGLVAKT